jgi:hypothetical protein
MPLPLMVCDTVVGETPALRATSWMVGRSLRGVGRSDMA